jgi:hypothetical protein
MIKTTNFEISKKLAEIGFRAECSYFYFHSDNNNYEASSLEAFGYDEISDCDIEDKYYPAYDLEILLDALPFGINQEDKRYDLVIEQNSFIYYSDTEGNELVKVDKKNNESLADMAGRLIILLHEKNLIKF